MINKVTRKQIIDIVLKHLPMKIDFDKVSYEDIEKAIQDIKNEFGFINETDGLYQDLHDLNYNFKMLKGENVLYDIDSQQIMQQIRNQLLRIRTTLIDRIIEEKFSNNISPMSDNEIIEYDIEKIPAFVTEVLYFVYNRKMDTDFFRQYVCFIYSYFDVFVSKFGQGNYFLPDEIENEINLLANADKSYHYVGLSEREFDYSFDENKVKKMPENIQNIVKLIIADIVKRFSEKQVIAKKNIELSGAIQAKLDANRIEEDTKMHKVIDVATSKMKTSEVTASVLEREKSINDSIQIAIQEKEELLANLAQVLEERTKLNDKSAELDAQIEEMLKKINGLNVSKK